MNQANTTLSEVIRLAIEKGAADLRVSMPGRIEKFYPETQTADVVPLLKDTVFQEGDEISESLGVISTVPVQFAGGGGYASTWPVAPGDLCWLVVADRSIDRWFKNGGAQDPVALHTHALTDAIAILGVRDEPSALAEFDQNRAVWGNKGPRIAADGSAVHIGVAHGEDGTQELIRGSQFLSDLQTLLNTIQANETSAASAMATAGASMNTGASLNATPVYGGALAAGAFNAVGAQFLVVQGLHTSTSTAVAEFLAKWSTFTTNKVKTP